MSDDGYGEESGAEPAPAERARPGRTALSIAAMLVAGLAIPLAGILIMWKACTHTAMQGRVEVAGSVLGSWRAPLGRCTAVAGTYAPGAGEVTLGRRDDNGPLVRFTLDPIDGAILTLWPLSGDRTVEIRARDCPALRATLTRPDGTHFDGKVSGSCPLAGGGTASIDVWFRGCGE